MLDKLIWISVTVIHETDLALRLDAGMDKDVWLPKSAINDYSEETYQNGDTIEIEIPEWIANRKGMI